MTYDPLEWTVRDPLEDTVPDPVPRRKRLSDGRRRAIEVAALLLLIPALLATEWIDDDHQARNWQTHERVTVVRRGGIATLGHVRLRLLGRDTTGSTTREATPSGAVTLKLVVVVRPLDAQGVKDVDRVDYTVRDRAGHVWSAGGSSDPDVKPQVGTDGQVTVTAQVPGNLINTVVLEARPGGLLSQKAPGPTPVLRFAH